MHHAIYSCIRGLVNFKVKPIVTPLSPACELNYNPYKLVGVLVERCRNEPLASLVKIVRAHKRYVRKLLRKNNYSHFKEQILEDNLKMLRKEI